MAPRKKKQAAEAARVSAADLHVKVSQTACSVVK